MASYCHHLIDSGLAFWIVKFVRPQNCLFVRPLFFTNNILIILLTPKDFWVFDFSTQFFFTVVSYCHHLIDFRPAFWIFKFVPRQNYHFRPNYGRNFPYFLEHLKISEFTTLRPNFPVASYCHHLTDSGPAFQVFQFFCRQNHQFRPNCGRNFLYFLKHLKISEFSTFRPNFFSCGKLLSSCNRFRTGILDFQIRPSLKSSFHSSFLFLLS